MENSRIGNEIQRKESNYKWAVLFSCAFMMVCITSVVTSWSVAVGELTESLNLTSTQVMMGSSAHILGLVVSSGILGRIVGEIGFKKSGIIFMAISIAAQLLLPLCTSFILILMLRFFTGFGLIFSPIYYIAGVWFSDAKQRGLAIGILGSMFFLGFTVGGLATGALIPAVGWRATFYIITAMIAVGTIQWAIICRRPNNYIEAEETHVEEERLEVAENAKRDNVFKHPMIWIMGLLFFCDSSIVYTVESASAVYLNDLAYNVESVGKLLSTASLLGIVAAPLAGIVTDRLIAKFSNKQPHTVRAIGLTIGGFAMVGIGILAVIFFGKIGFALCAAALLVVGWGNAFMDSLINMTGIDAFGPEKGDKVIGYMTLIGGVGGIIAPVFISWLGTTYSWTLAWSIVAILVVIGLVGSITMSKLRANY